jgi:hypothetical protein
MKSIIAYVFKFTHLKQNYKKRPTARHWWLISAISATQETVIRRIADQSQPW